MCLPPQHPVPLTVRFRTTSGLDSAVDPVQMKNVTFEHVKGVEEAKNELQEVVEFLRSPQKFTVLGGKLPKGEGTRTTFVWCCFCNWYKSVVVVVPQKFTALGGKLPKGEGADTARGPILFSAVVVIERRVLSCTPLATFDYAFPNRFSSSPHSFPLTVSLSLFCLDKTGVKAYKVSFQKPSLGKTFKYILQCTQWQCLI